MSSSRAKQNRPGRRLTAVYRRGFEDGGRAALGAAMSAAEPAKTPFEVASEHIPEARVSLLSRAIRQGLNDYGWKNFGTLPEVLMGYIVQAERAEAEAHPKQPAPSVAVKALRQAASDFMHLFIQDGHLTVQGLEDTDLIPAYEKLFAALSAQVLDEPLRVGRFGHHPEPAIDFCIEVEALEGHLFDAKHGIGKPGHEPRGVDDDFRRRVSDAMDFIVGGDRIAIAAKATLRSISAQVQDLADSPAIKAIVAERARQIEKEGWSPEHDDEHTDGSLALAAGSYCESAARPKILARKSAGAFAIPKLWPQSWSRDWWKPKSPREDLVRAAALIIAEIERIDRATKKD